MKEHIKQVFQTWSIYCSNSMSEKISQPMNWIDSWKDAACEAYINDYGLDSLLDDIREQIDDKSILEIYSDSNKFKNIIYSCLEQKLIELVDQYNYELDNDDPIDPMDAAGHTDRDFF